MRKSLTATARGGVLLAAVALVLAAWSPPALAATTDTDLFFIKTSETGSNSVEVHSATAASGYTSGQHIVTYFSPYDRGNGSWQMVGSDLFFIKTSETGSNSVEVHSATAASGYTSGQHIVTYFNVDDAFFNGTLQMVGSDLFFIKTSETGSGSVEVHSATAASGYTSGQHIVTYFSPYDRGNGSWQMVGSDLFFIKTSETGSNSVEIHTATAASGYTSGQHIVTYFSPYDRGNGSWQMVGSDLYFIKTSVTGSNSVEVHSATAASGYTSGQHIVTYFNVDDAFFNGTLQMRGMTKAR